MFFGCVSAFKSVVREYYIFHHAVEAGSPSSINRFSYYGFCAETRFKVVPYPLSDTVGIFTVPLHPVEDIYYFPTTDFSKMIL